MSIIKLQEGIQMSPEREAYHRWLGTFRSKLKPGSVLYDIGKSHIYDYSQFMKDFTYKTIDCDKSKKPDIFMDMEWFAKYNALGIDRNMLFLEAAMDMVPAEAVMCNGVIEQCNNPFLLMEGINKLMVEGGLVLMGIISVGFPIYVNDRIRFTPFGARKLMTYFGFRIVDEEIVAPTASKIPTYMYLICRKESNV